MTLAPGLLRTGADVVGGYPWHLVQRRISPLGVHAALRSLAS
jgi:hypothetical protein